MRRAYQHTNQGVLVSVQIALVHAMAEGIVAELVLCFLPMLTFPPELCSTPEVLA